MEDQLSENREMTRIVLIPAGKTLWEEEGRVLGDADIPLTEEGKGSIIRWGKQVGKHIDVIYTAPTGPAKESAEIIGNKLGVKVKVEKDLADINMGLWQGMLFSELQARHPKVYKQWKGTPEKVTPPKGESLLDLKDRLDKVITKIIKKHKGKRIGIVIGQFGLAVLRQKFEGKSIEQIKNILKEELTWHEYIVKDGT